MKFHLKFKIMMCAGWLMALCGMQAAYSQQPQPAAPGRLARSKKSYDTMVKNLDTGGDLMVVANMDGFLEDTLKEVLKILSEPAAVADEKLKTVRETLTKVHAFLKTSGLYGMDGYGLSMVPRADGLNTIKSFLVRDPAVRDLLLWKGLVGGEPRELKSLAFAPADSVLCSIRTGEAASLWKLVKAGMAELASPEKKAAFDAGVARLSLQWGISVDDLIASVADEILISLQLSSVRTMEMPTPNGTFSIPEPSLLIAVAVKGDVLQKFVEARLAQSGLPVNKSLVGATALQSLFLPIPVPMPVQPTMALHSGILLIGSSAEVVTSAIESFEKKNGLPATPEYRKLFAGLPSVNNGIFYMSPRFSKVIQEIQTKSLEQQGAGLAVNQQVLNKIFQHVFFSGREDAHAYILLNGPEGLANRGVSTGGGTDVVKAVMLMPAGILAGIAVPSFVQSRTTSQHNSCINNLRQLDSAKEQWAMAERKADGDAVNIPEMLQYVKGTTMPVCPQGGAYSVNAIGEAPTCSIPGHSMDW